MTKEIIFTPQAPAPIGPYSQAIRSGDWLFLSMQLGLDPKKKELAEGIESQTKQIMENFQAILQEVDADISALVKVVVYLRRLSDFSTFNRIYSTYVTPPHPARSVIAVTDLPLAAEIAMDAIAVIIQGK